MNIATVVTFNKIESLKECLCALLNQTIPLDIILVVDNASTDGTKEFLQKFGDKRLQPIFSESNLGGAGGFNLALKEAMKYEPENIWVMDDDSIVEPEALENLLKARSVLKGKFGFLASNVLWIDRTPCLMNIPKPDRLWISHAYDGLSRIKTASFVSMLINAEMVKKVGYPISDFFIWGDDIEFSDRISDFEPSYFVSNSIVIHKMEENSQVDILSDSKNRIPRYYYDQRNKFYRFRKKGTKEVVKYIINSIALLIRIIFAKNDNKLLKIKTIIRGLTSGIFFNPKIEEYKSEVR